VVFEELIQRLEASGRDAAKTAAWRVGDDWPAWHVEYSIMTQDGHYVVASLVNDRSNGTVLLNKHNLSDGTESPYFDTADQACDWIWERVNNPAFIPQPAPKRTPEQIEEHRRRVMEDIERNRRAFKETHQQQD